MSKQLERVIAHLTASLDVAEVSERLDEIYGLDDNNIDGSRQLMSGNSKNKSCKDDEEFLYKNKNGKNCEFIGQTRKRKKKLCKKSNISQLCPVTCGKCRTKCPKQYSSPKFKKSCAKYEDGLNCNFNHMFTGCSWNSIQCTGQQSYECNESKWRLITMMPQPCANPPLDFPLHDECAPCPKVEPANKCPSSQPDVHSKCSTIGLECSYDFRYLGCGLEELKCVPLTFYTCSEEKIWEMAVVDIKICPEETRSASPTSMKNIN